MLRGETGAVAAGANVANADGRAGDRCERDRGTDELPAAFTVCTVDFQHGRYGAKR
jgi:hypothetical protein